MDNPRQSAAATEKEPKSADDADKTTLFGCAFQGN
jgi:hypothetical protein